MTEFILIKNNLECRTPYIFLVKALKRMGWKIKQSELGELI